MADFNAEMKSATEAVPWEANIWLRGLTHGDQEFERLRKAYIGKLQELLAELKESGLIDRARELEAEISSVGNSPEGFDRRFEC